MELRVGLPLVDPNAADAAFDLRKRGADASPYSHHQHGRFSMAMGMVGVPLTKKLILSMP